MYEELTCPVCQSESALHDVVDFNKSCDEGRGHFLPLKGDAVYYALCSQCGFCFAPELARWSLEQFEEHIYNEDYGLVDPEYVLVRPRNSAAVLTKMFGQRAHSLRHLDYGGGNGLLASMLNETQWQSTSFDPFVDRGLQVHELGKFDLITAFEVFEHVPDVQVLMANLMDLLAPGGLVLFSTLVSNGHIHPNQRLTWWYAAPRNGHISLFTRESLATLALQQKLIFGSFSEGFHFYCRQVPEWATHLFQTTDPADVDASTKGVPAADSSPAHSEGRGGAFARLASWFK